MDKTKIKLTGWTTQGLVTFLVYNDASPDMEEVAYNIDGLLIPKLMKIAKHKPGKAFNYAKKVGTHLYSTKLTKKGDL